MGLLQAADWSAKWIGYPYAAEMKEEPAAPLFRAEFDLDSKPVRAMAYVAIMGYGDLHVNGEKIGKGVCGPNVSDYNKRAYYVTHEVTGALRRGANCVGIALGRGWYCEGFPGVTHPGPIARVQIEVEMEGGKTIVVCSDAAWGAHLGPVTAIGRVNSSNIDGERYDARAEISGWDEPGLDPEWAEKAVVVEPPVPVIGAAMLDSNRIVEEVAAVDVKKTGPGEYLFDMGRNVTAMFRLRVRGEPGKPVRMKFIERFEKSGEPVWWDQQDEYVPATDGVETFENRFNYHAFRYVKASGLRREPRLADATALFLQTPLDARGSFACSNDLFNRIYDTTLYTFRCVTAGGVSVDCPHRERLGYGGDGQITTRTALYAFDLGAMYTKWLGNWRDVQDLKNGWLPNIAPSPHNAGGGPTWGAISIMLPWDMYLHYGDARVMSENYPMMKRYIEFLDSKSADGLLRPYGHENYGFIGDWVAPDRDQGTGPWSSELSRTFFNNCFYAYICDHMSNVSKVLGETQDAESYARKAGEIRLATHGAFFNPEHTYADGGQANLAFALLSGVTPDDLRPAVMKSLETEIVEKKGGHIDAGMHGSMFLLRLLNETGRDDLAALIMNQKTYPGWGYMLEQGATTLWERWEGARSQIHSTLLAAGEWFPRVLGGIRPDESGPGFRRVIIDPRPVGGVTWAKTTYDTAQGLVATEWRVKNGKLTLNVNIPANATALVRVPGANATVKQSEARLVRQQEGYTEFEAPSGDYEFGAKF
jgi:alpha-L-rhamnosidase